MNKVVFIYKIKNIYKILPEILTDDGFAIQYLPVFTLQKNSGLDIKILALNKCFAIAGKTVKLSGVPGDRKAYENYVDVMMDALGEKSFNALQKKSKEYVLEFIKTDNLLRIIPLVNRREGSVPVKDSIQDFQLIGKIDGTLTKKVFDFIEQES